MTQICIFLSTVSAEFRSYRDALRHDLERPNVITMVQEDFIATGMETLDKLDDYLRQCDAVIHCPERNLISLENHSLPNETEEHHKHSEFLSS